MTSAGFATGNQGGGFGILPAMQGVSAVDTCRPLQDFEALSNQWSLAQRNHDPGLLMPVSLPNGRFPLSGDLLLNLLPPLTCVGLCCLRFTNCSCHPASLAMGCHVSTFFGHIAISTSKERIARRSFERCCHIGFPDLVAAMF